MKNFAKLSAFSLLVALFSSNALAASATGNASATVLRPLTITATTPLAFGTFTTATGGTIASPSGTVTGDVVAVGSGRTAGVFTVNEASNSQNTAYTLSALPSPITLTRTGGSGTGLDAMTATITLASGTTSRTLSSGSDTITINGVLTAQSGQNTGAYTGTYTLTVNY